MTKIGTETVLSKEISSLFVEKSSIVVGSMIDKTSFYSTIDVYQVVSATKPEDFPKEFKLTDQQLKGYVGITFLQQKFVLKEGNKITIKIRSKPEKKIEETIKAKKRRKHSK